MLQNIDRLGLSWIMESTWQIMCLRLPFGLNRYLLLASFGREAKHHTFRSVVDYINIIIDAMYDDNTRHKLLIKLERDSVLKYSVIKIENKDGT